LADSALLGGAAGNTGCTSGTGGFASNAAMPPPPNDAAGAGLVSVPLVLLPLPGAAAAAVADGAADGAAASASDTRSPKSFFSRGITSLSPIFNDSLRAPGLIVSTGGGVGTGGACGGPAPLKLLLDVAVAAAAGLPSGVAGCGGRMEASTRIACIDVNVALAAGTFTTRSRGQRVVGER